MPIYEFVCGECGHEFEKILSFSAATPVCAKCGTVNVERQMGRPAIHFKGSGWYITDSKKGGSAKDKSATVPSASSDGEAEKGKVEKTAATSENGASGDSKVAESSKEKPASKESAASSTAKAEAA